jgi:hypothetical protein
LRSLSSRPPVILTVVALAVVVVLGAAVAFAQWNAPDSATAAGESPGAGQPAKSSTSPSWAAAASTPNSQSRRADLAECQAYFRQQLSAAQTAAVSLNQWREHIQAMNQLVAGLISLDQAKQYWNQTRKGAIHKVAAFRHLEQQLTASSGCARSATGRHRLARCDRATTAYDRALDAARTTIATWQMHINDMESLRNGQLSAQRAAKMWIHNWRVGAHQLARYDHLAARAQGKTCV